MRLAILSDVHGNRFALSAVLDDIGRERPDLSANLGDSVWGASDPGGAWRILQGLNLPTVRGNTDEMIARTHPAEGEAGPYAEWVRSQLPPDVPATLATLPLTAEFAGGEVLVAHGSLRDAWEPLMLLPGEDFRTLVPAPPQVLAERVAGTKAKVVVVGHTHREMMAGVSGKTIINAGPVSRPFDGLAAARWLLLEKRSGLWSAQFRRVPYDAAAAAAWAGANSPYGAQERGLLGID